MYEIAARAAARESLRRPDVIPAPGPASLGLLAVLRHARPLSELRSAALTAGMSMEMVEVALSVATRRGEMRLEADGDGTVLAVWRRP